MRESKFENISVWTIYKETEDKNFWIMGYDLTKNILEHMNWDRFTSLFDEHEKFKEWARDTSLLKALDYIIHHGDEWQKVAWLFYVSKIYDERFLDKYNINKLKHACGFSGECTCENDMYIGVIAPIIMSIEKRELIKHIYSWV